MFGRLPPFGLAHGVITEEQYSYLVATVIGSAVVPTVIANAFYMPRHLLHDSQPEIHNAIIEKKAESPTKQNQNFSGFSQKRLNIDLVNDISIVGNKSLKEIKWQKNPYKGLFK